MRIVPTLESVVAKSISNVAADDVHPPSARLLRHVALAWAPTIIIASTIGLSPVDMTIGLG